MERKFNDVDYENEFVYQDMISRNAEEIVLKIDFEIFSKSGTFGITHLPKWHVVLKILT